MVTVTHQKLKEHCNNGCGDNKIDINRKSNGLNNDNSNGKGNATFNKMEVIL